MTKILGIAPSLVDISVVLEHADYLRCSDQLQTQPGGWSKINDYDQIQALFDIIVSNSNKDPIMDSLLADPKVSISAGSSILGMLSVMPPSVRFKSSIATTMGGDGQTLDPLSAYFKSEVIHAGLVHFDELVAGNNPLGFVLASTENPEKILAMYPGISSELQANPCDTYQPEIVLVDAYELQDGKISLLVKEIIDSKRHKVALSLGNAAIIAGTLKDTIAGYIDDGKIFALFGNEEEYTALFDDAPDAATPANFLHHPIKDKVPYAVITGGLAGIAAHWEGTFVATTAYPMNQATIVNTSGAGDVVAGVCTAAIIENTAPLSAVKKAAYLATKVLGIPGSRILRSQ